LGRGVGEAGEGELFATCGEAATDASCRETEAPFAPLLLAGAAPAVIARRSFRFRFLDAGPDADVDAGLIGTTRTEGGAKNHDGVNGLPP
jgi:hypothetical protein